MGWSEQEKLGFDLTDWLLDAGEEVAKRSQALGSLDALTPVERLVYEFWIFDMEQQNGGVSQYFFNRSIQQWSILANLAREVLPSFDAFAILTVQRVAAESPESNLPAIDSQDNLDDLDDLDDLYGAIRIPLLLELRSLVDRERPINANTASEL